MCPSGRASKPFSGERGSLDRSRAASFPGSPDSARARPSRRRRRAVRSSSSRSASPTATAAPPSSTTMRSWRSPLLSISSKTLETSADGFKRTSTAAKGSSGSSGSSGARSRSRPSRASPYRALWETYVDPPPSQLYAPSTTCRGAVAGGMDTLPSTSTMSGPTLEASAVGPSVSGSAASLYFGVLVAVSGLMYAFAFERGLRRGKLSRFGWRSVTIRSARRSTRRATPTRAGARSAESSSTRRAPTKQECGDPFCAIH